MPKIPKRKTPKPSISKRLLADLQWCAREGTEYLLSVRDCKALVEALLKDDATAQTLRDAGFLVENDTETL